MKRVFDPKVHCGAKNRAGLPCTKGKGAGTDHPRRGRCSNHGGSSPNGRKQAKTEAAREALAALGKPVPTNPMQLLQDLVDQANGMLRAASSIVRELKSGELDEDAMVRIKLLREVMVEAGRIAKSAAEAVNEETLVQVSVQTAELIHRVLTNALDAYEKVGPGEAGRRAAEEQLIQDLLAVQPVGDARN